MHGTTVVGAPVCPYAVRGTENINTATVVFPLCDARTNSARTALPDTKHAYAGARTVQCAVLTARVWYCCYYQVPLPFYLRSPPCESIGVP
eukprot:3369462-Rhodomonas_salina.1